MFFYNADFKPKIIKVARQTIKKVNKHRGLKMQIHELTDPVIYWQTFELSTDCVIVVFVCMSLTNDNAQKNCNV